MSLANPPVTLEDTGVNLDESMAIQKFGDVFLFGYDSPMQRCPAPVVCRVEFGSSVYEKSS